MPVNLLNEKDLNNYLADTVYHGEEIQTFKSGNFKSVDYVKQNKDAIVRSMMYQWFKHRMRSHLVEKENAEFLTPVKMSEDLPNWAKDGLSKGENIYNFDATKVPQKLTGEIEKVRDFLYGAAESYVNKTLARAEDSKQDPKLRIDYLKTTNEYDSFEKALEAANKWHEILANKAENKKRDEELYKKSLEGTKSVMKLADGMEVVQLTTNEALDYESEYMGHCVGKGGYDAGVRNGSIKIYSIRDADGVPHVTFEVQGKDVVQCKGKGNKAPAGKYIRSVQSFIEKMGFDVKGDLANTGMIKQDDKCYSIWNLPKGFVVEGDLNLSGMGFTELPDLSHVIVMGNFICSHNKLTSLEGAPQKIGGDFGCYSNKLTTLEGAPQEVGGVFDCSDNQLTTLDGAPQEVGGYFDCGINQLTALEGAPQKIGGYFGCYGNKLTSLEGAPQEVGGGFNCCINQLTTLKGAPQEVGGDFYCGRNQLTTLEGAPQEVGGYFDCSYNLLTTLKGAPQEVGRDFYCCGNELTTLEGAPQKVCGSFYCTGNPDITTAPRHVLKYCNNPHIREWVKNGKRQASQQNKITELRARLQGKEDKQTSKDNAKHPNKTKISFIKKLSDFFSKIK